jgi:hypothetical protein
VDGNRLPKSNGIDTSRKMKEKKTKNNMGDGIRKTINERNSQEKQ